VRKLILIALLLLTISSVYAQDDLPPPPQDIEANLDGVLDTLQTESTPGAVLLVVNPNWMYEKAVGVTERGGSEPVTPDMAFQIGSNTKMMTATIIMQLHEEDLLDVNDLISDYLPDVAARLTNGEDITILQLLKHRSGLWDYVDGTVGANNGLFYQAIEDEAIFSKTYSYDEIIEFIVANGEPTFAPDSLDESGEPNFAYSNTGYLLLGMIIEAVLNEPINEIFEARIFTPLSMENTYYETGVAPNGTTPRGYFEDMDTTDFNLSMAGPAGAVISTPRDMVTFITSLMNGILFEDSETLEIMMSDPKILAATGGNYALGIQDKGAMVGITGLWGHGGQSLAFESDVAYHVLSNTAVVAWTSYYSTPVAFASTEVMSALGVIEQSAYSAATFDDILGELLYVISLNAGDTTFGTTEDNRSNYTVTFNEGGDVAITADCNQATASYTLDDENTVTITPGITTLMACGPDSNADVMMDILQNISTYYVIGIDDDYEILLTSEDVDGGSIRLNSNINAE
jgi:D-alanyl-D-alanine carboxypeptidase